MRLLKFTFVCAVLSLELSEVTAKPFFNPFNLAIKMEAGKDGGGHQLTFIYPRQSTKLAVNVKTETLETSSFDLAGILSSFTKLFSGKFASLSKLSNPFGGMTTTTGKTELDFSEEVTDDYNSFSSSTSSSDDFSGEVDSSSSGYDSEENRHGYSKPSTSAQNSNESGYDYSKPTTTSYSVETVPIEYLPPDARDYLPPVTDLPIKIYLPSN